MLNVITVCVDCLDKGMLMNSLRLPKNFMNVWLHSVISCSDRKMNESGTDPSGRLKTTEIDTF